MCTVTEEQIGEEERAFKSGRGNIDQILTLKKICEKMGKKRIKLYFI